MRKIPTSEAVYTALREAHPELKPFGSYTAIDGEVHNPSRGVISTSYGFDGQVDPIVMYERSWHCRPSSAAKRLIGIRSNQERPR